MSVETARTSTKPGSLAVRIAQRSDVGRVRSENQDCAAVRSLGEERALLVVADGMGGHRGGATASRLAAEALTGILGDLEIEDPGQALHDAFVEANDRILTQSQQSVDLRGMGTTCSAMLILDGRAWVGHVGDSRVYRIRGGEAEQLTADHSLVATMVREGLLSEHEAEVHPRRNVLQRSVGVVADVEIDVSEPFDLLEGDVFVLCSDGLHGLVRPEEIVAGVADRDEESAVRELVDLALERGAPDNVTVVVARIGPPPAASPREGDRGSARGERGSGWAGWMLLIGLLIAAVIGIALVMRGD